MEYTYEVHPDLKVLSVRLSGMLYKKDVALIDHEIRLKARELNYKIVLDFRDTSNYMSFGDAYFWFGTNSNNMSMDLIYIPVVHVTNEQDEYFFNFLEITSNNKGARIKTCRDQTSAFQWLEKL